MTCVDCRHCWDYEFAEDGNTIVNSDDCPECGSDAVEVLVMVDSDEDRAIDRAYETWKQNREVRK